MVVAGHTVKCHGYTFCAGHGCIEDGDVIVCVWLLLVFVSIHVALARFVKHVQQRRQCHVVVR